MNQRMFEELARQRRAEVQRLSTGPQFWSPPATAPAMPEPPRTALARPATTRTGPAGTGPAGRRLGARDASRSLRARTGWRLVDLGLKLVVQPDSRPASSPRPAGS